MKTGEKKSIKKESLFKSTPQINDIVFIVLNSLAALMSFLGLFYTLKYRKKR